VCAQIRMEAARDHLGQAKPAEEALGVPPYATQMALTQDVCKELVNKIAWTLGSVYARPYNNNRCLARAYAWDIAWKIIKDHGYPDKIAK